MAIVPIVLLHAGLTTLPGGFVGVDVFFVISGYLITGILMRDLDRGTFSLAGFYRRRAVRILPALLVLLLVTLIIGCQRDVLRRAARAGAKRCCRRHLRLERVFLASHELFRFVDRREAAAAYLVARDRRTILCGLPAAAGRAGARRAEAVAALHRHRRWTVVCAEPAFLAHRPRGCLLSVAHPRVGTRAGRAGRPRPLPDTALAVYRRSDRCDRGLAWWSRLCS